MKTMYVTDLDGTLLNTQDRISEESIRIINGLIDYGMLFTYATARSLSSASIVTKGLSTKLPVIVYNGAFIIYPHSGEVLSSLSFSSSEAEYVRECLHGHGISPLVYSFVNNVEKVSWEIMAENEGKKRYLALRKGDRRLRPLKSAQGLYDGKMFYFTCIGEKEELMPIYDIFSKDSRFRCTLQQELYRTEFWCEIMPAKATKAEAIKKLKEIWDCDRIVSFGDAINDMPMFEISDESYAVENAVPELKRIATAIIKGNDHDGVAKWMQSNFDYLQ